MLFPSQSRGNGGGGFYETSCKDSSQPLNKMRTSLKHIRVSHSEKPLLTGLFAQKAGGRGGVLDH